MTRLDAKINQARFRLNVNRFFYAGSWAVIIAGGLWSLTWIIEQAFVLGMPLGISLVGAGVVGLSVAAVLFLNRRVDRLSAAIALDGAAGMKERFSTGLVVARDADPFARAALQDAEQAAGRVTVPVYLRYHAPRQWPWSVFTVLLAAGLAAFLPRMDLLAGENDEQRDRREQVEIERKNVEVAVNEQMKKLKALAEKNPELSDLKDELAPLALPTDAALTPDDIRREASKKLEAVRDKLESQKNAAGEDKLKQLRRMLATIEPPNGDDKLTQRLSRALAAGDFEAAKKVLDQMKKQLAEDSKDADPEAKKRLADMQKRMESLAKKVAAVANNKQLQKELQNKAGMSEEQARELLKQLSKMDAKQLKKELQKRLGDKGLSEEQLEQLAKKIAANQAAQKMAQRMAQKMAQAAQCMNPGQSQDSGQAGAQAQAAVQGMMDQLSELEMAEQALNEMEAQLAELRDLQEDISAGACQGPGQEFDPNRIGNQGPQFGLGQGARIGRERAAHAYKSQKSKSKMRNGKIIGQMLIDGDQLRGDSTAQARDAVNAAVRDASAEISEDRVPRQYHKVMRKYFDRLANLADRQLAGKKDNKPAGDSDK